MLKKISLITILVLALYLRIINIATVPPGIYLDEASIAYDSYSLGLNLHDQYGKFLPLFIRSYASFQAPLYIYASILPIKVFGMSPLGVRFISIVSGTLIVFFSYLLIRIISPEKWKNAAIFSAAVLAISPWAIFFSRGAIEANLALALFIASLYLIFNGIKNNKGSILNIGFITLALTNYAYHSYRFLSIITVLALLTFFFKLLKKRLFIPTVIGIILFAVILLPQLFLINTPGSLTRATALDYTSDSYFKENSGTLCCSLPGKITFISRTFFAKYFDYISLNSLFFDSDPSPVRSIPELGSFYSWMLFPFLLGLFIVTREYYRKSLRAGVNFFMTIGLFSIVPAAFTRDDLYFLRVLPFLWLVSILAGFGLLAIFKRINSNLLKLGFATFLLTISLLNLYTNYFYIFKEERSVEQSGLLQQLFIYTRSNPDKHFIIDLTEPLSYGIGLYVYKTDPKEFSRQANLKMMEYYTDTSLKTNYSIGNTDIRAINWGVDNCQGNYLVGDERTISEERISSNHLLLVRKFVAVLDTRFIGVYRSECKKPL